MYANYYKHFLHLTNKHCINYNDEMKCMIWIVKIFIGLYYFLFNYNYNLESYSTYCSIELQHWRGNIFILKRDQTA